VPGGKSDGYQVLLVERMAREGAQFLNAHVFPGGQVDAADNNDIRRAALRELYEEVSLYLQPDPSSGNSKKVIPRTVEVDTSQISYNEYLRTNGAGTAERSLIPYSRWITPKFMRKRFDTHFLLALASPSKWMANGKVDGTEVKSLAWLTPAEALDRYSQHKITLFPPQWYCVIFFAKCRYMLSDLKANVPTFSAMEELCQQLPETPMPMRPQAFNVSKVGFTMVFHGDEAYKADDDEPRSEVGGRHRIIIESSSGRPQKMTLEIKNRDNSSKL
jgi:8-oxo-dGTP pyrophosphatase MutT (NUDIX family)